MSTSSFVSKFERMLTVLFRSSSVVYFAGANRIPNSFSVEPKTCMFAELLVSCYSCNTKLRMNIASK